MPKIDNNPIMKGVSGMLGGVVVYRQFRGMTILSNRPRKTKVITPHQQKIKSRFLLAVEYAKKQIADPVLKARYEPQPGSKVTSAYIAAITDYLRRVKLDGDGNEHKPVERLPHDDSLNGSRLREIQIAAEHAELTPAAFRSAGTSCAICDFPQHEIDRIDADTDVSNHTENLKAAEQIKRTVNSIPRYTINDTFTQYAIMTTTLERKLTTSRAGP